MSRHSWREWLRSNGSSTNSTSTDTMATRPSVRRSAGASPARSCVRGARSSTAWDRWLCVELSPAKM
jgi:hypothetical protein